MLIAIAILGILTSVAMPRFFKQYQKSCQAEAATKLNLLANSASAYKDIYGDPPETWPELNQISAVMTTDGPADESRFAANEDENCNKDDGSGDGECPEDPETSDDPDADTGPDADTPKNPYAEMENLSNAITTPGCDYKLSRSSERSGEQFIFTAVPTPNTGDKAAFNVVSCFDLRTGASDLKRGSKDVTGAAEINDLVCWK